MQEKSYLYRARRLLAREVILPYDQIAFSRKNVSTARALNQILCRIEGGLKISRPQSYPIALQLEPTIQCQLDCPYCPRLRATKGMTLGHMEWDKYQNLMREVGPYLTAVAFWQWGEPLLHPRISEMVRLASSYGIITFISTNAQTNLDELDIEALMDSGLDMIIISMDGSSQQIYERFRASGQVEQVKTFTRELTALKKARGGKGPLINIRSIATRENEAEISAVRDFARQAGADLFSIKSLSLYYDESPQNPHLPEAKHLRSFQYRGSAEADEYRRKANYCRKPWSWPTLRYDGTLLWCECDHQMISNLGNVFASGSFKEVWQGPAAVKLRKKYKLNGSIDLEFCQRCRYKLDDAIRHVEWLAD